LAIAPRNDGYPSGGGQAIRCVLADDHTLLREGMRRLLEESPDFTVVGEAADASEALKQVIEQRPDIVLLDISMPGMSSFEAARLIEEHCRETRVVFVTMHEDMEYLSQAMRAGASGYLLKDTPAPHLLHALRGVHRGEKSFSPRILRQMQEEQDGMRKAQRGQPDRTTLTPREREVMKLLAEGHTVRQSAEQLGVSVKTVEAHKFNLMRKLDIHNKAQLVTVAIRKKIVSVPVQT